MAIKTTEPVTPSSGEANRIILTGLRIGTKDLAVCGCRVDDIPEPGLYVHDLDGFLLSSENQWRASDGSTVATCTECRRPHWVLDLATAMRVGVVQPEEGLITIPASLLSGAGGCPRVSGPTLLPFRGIQVTAS